MACLPRDAVHNADYAVASVRLSVYLFRSCNVLKRLNI